MNLVFAGLPASIGAAGMADVCRRIEQQVSAGDLTGLSAMVDQLDSRRAQIYIESMIVEVSGDNAADFGFQWQGVGFLGGSEKYGLFAGTNSSVGGPSIISLTTSLASTSVSRNCATSWRCTKRLSHEPMPMANR